MMFRSGYITFPRSLVSSDLWRQLVPNHRIVFLAIVSMANWRDGEWPLGTEKVPIRRGQLVTSQQHLADDCGRGITQRIVRVALKRLEAVQLIVLKPVQQYTFITVVDYDVYSGQQRHVANCEARGMARESPVEVHRPSTIESIKKENAFRKENKPFTDMSDEDGTQTTERCEPPSGFRDFQKLISELTNDKDINRVTGRGEDK